MRRKKRYRDRVHEMKKYKYLEKDNITTQINRKANQRIETR